MNKWKVTFGITTWSQIKTRSVIEHCCYRFMYQGISNQSCLSSYFANGLSLGSVCMISRKMYVLSLSSTWEDHLRILYSALLYRRALWPRWFHLLDLTNLTYLAFCFDVYVSAKNEGEKPARRVDPAHQRYSVPICTSLQPYVELDLFSLHDDAI